MRQRLLFCSAVLFSTSVWAQAPTITALSPARNTTAVARTAPISITLSQPVGAGAGTVRVFSAQRGGRLTGTATAAGNVLTFVPPQSFRPGEVLAVTVPTTVQSAAGVALAAPQVYQFTAAATGGTGTFAVGPTVPVAGAAYSVVATDVDGDGDLDLLAADASYNPSTISLRLNDGSGGFTPGPSPVVGNLPQHLLALDVDGDSDPDLVSCNGNSLSVRLNNGQGVFGGGSDPTVGLRPSNVAAGDIDGDGDQDLVVANSGDVTVSILLNNGTGTFTQSTALSGGYNLLALGDVDGDGDLDLLTNAPGSYGNYNVGLRLNTGNGTFGPAQLVSFGSYEFRTLTLADLDGDGDLDLAAATSADVVTLRNNGQGLFGAPAPTPNTTGMSDVRAADVDGDGDLDLYMFNAASVSVRLNNGAGIFSGTGSLPVGSSPNEIREADIDGDGDLDLVVASYRELKVLLNTNSAPPLRVSTVAPSRNLRNAPRTSNVVVGFNQTLDNTPATTGALQVTSSQRGGRLAGTATLAGSSLLFDPAIDFRPGERLNVSITTAAHSGGFLLSQPQVYQFTAAVGGGTGTFAPAGGLNSASFPSAVATGDIDGDGDLDVLSIGDDNGGGFSSAIVTISRNTGTGTFVAGSGAGAGVDPTGLAVADIDGDGDLDVLTSNGTGYTGSPGTINISLNNGQGVFSDGPSLAVGSATQGLTVGDVDGDGDQDIIFINNGYFGNGFPSAGLCRNAGNGTFGTAQTITTGGSLTAVTLADVDNDGDLDLLTTTASSVSICRNDGLGTFGTYGLAAAFHAKSLATADVDGDGDLDLLTADGTGFGVSLNDGSGSFSTGSSLAVPNTGNYSSLAVGDLDGDGDPDAVIGNGNYAATMSVRLNNGAGVFGGGYDPVVASGRSMPNAAALADVNGDGNLDLLVLNYSNGGGEVLLNQTNPIIEKVAPTSGPVGSTVTITGNNLAGTTILTLNGVTIPSFTVLNATTIMFVVPAGASSGPIAATTPLGTATSSSFTVTVASNTQLGTNASAVVPYPNPTHDVLHIPLSGLVTAGQVVRIELFNQLGQLVSRNSLAVARQQAEATIPVGGLAAGLYALRVHVSTGIITRMIRVE